MEHGQANWFRRLALPSDEISAAIAKLLAQLHKQDPNKALNHDSPTQVCLISYLTPQLMMSCLSHPKDGPKTTMFLTPAFLRTAETTNCHSSLHPTSAAESPEIKWPNWSSKNWDQGFGSQTLHRLLAFQTKNTTGFTGTLKRNHDFHVRAIPFCHKLGWSLGRWYRSIAFFHHRWGTIFFIPAIYRGLFGLALSSKWECLKPRVPPWQLQNSVGKAQDFSSPFFETSRYFKQATISLNRCSADSIPSLALQWVWKAFLNMGNLINLRAFGPGCCKWSTFCRPHWWEQKFAMANCGNLVTSKIHHICKKVFTSAKSVPFCETQTWHHDTCTLTNVPKKFHGSVPLVAFVRRQQSLSLWPTDSSCSQRLPRKQMQGWMGQRVNKLKGLGVAVVNGCFATLETTWLKIVFIFGGMQFLQKLQLHIFQVISYFQAQQNELMSIL